jgi:hypothetical protein
MIGDVNTMTLFEQWKELIASQTNDSMSSFWEDYSAAEKRIYSSILADKKNLVSGIFSELAQKYDVTDVLFMGFLDGINSSLTREISIENMDQESIIALEINFEKLYFNMLVAEADYLYGLPEWGSIITEEKAIEITKEYKKSKTIVKGPQIGRNDPCPCGSGKKYKKCCGA